jgi:hypothetical protein
MSDELIHGLPLLSRNFVGLFAAIPQGRQYPGGVPRP